MAWFRRRRTDQRPAPRPEAFEGTAADPAERANGAALVPLVPADSLERTERALKMLASQSAQLHGQIVGLERRIDALSDALADQLGAPTNDDLLEARSHSARVASELARLEVNLAARLDAVRDELRAAQGLERELDLRSLTPADTGWTPAR